MRKIGVSSTLTVYHDGQFWVGMFECIEDGQLSACRIVFGAEPSAEEILQLVCQGWNGLRFTQAVELDETAPQLSSNPKRRQCEASRELKQRGPSTKAQQAISQEREMAAHARKSKSRERREQERQSRFEKRQEKRKRKNRGK
ncbi:MAG: YjdF family protein [Coriobacteriales bacterium]|nr:YjdF family protein [Coriobacteriales bacterium]